MMGQKQAKQRLQDVDPRHGEPEFLQQRLKVLFRGLLTVKADLVMQSDLAVSEFCCGDEVRFRLSDPLRRQLFHQALCLGS